MTSTRCVNSKSDFSFQNYYASIGAPFEWRFTRKDLADLIKKIDAAQNSVRPAA
jgi:hypothetical protein